MKNGQVSSNSLQLSSTPMITSAALIGAGSLIGITGLIMAGTALISATRQWFLELDLPATEVVRQKWGQATTAAVAGASAWQRHNGAQARRVRV